MASIIKPKHWGKMGIKCRFLPLVSLQHLENDLHAWYDNISWQTDAFLVKVFSFRKIRGSTFDPLTGMVLPCELDVLWWMHFSISYIWFKNMTPFLYIFYIKKECDAFECYSQVLKLAVLWKQHDFCVFPSIDLLQCVCPVDEHLPFAHFFFPS